MVRNLIKDNLNKKKNKTLHGHAPSPWGHVLSSKSLIVHLAPSPAGHWVTVYNCSQLVSQGLQNPSQSLSSHKLFI